MGLEGAEGVGGGNAALPGRAEARNWPPLTEELEACSCGLGAGRGSGSGTDCSPVHWGLSPRRFWEDASLSHTTRTWARTGPGGLDSRVSRLGTPPSCSSTRKGATTTLALSRTL